MSGSSDRLGDFIRRLGLTEEQAAELRELTEGARRHPGKKTYSFEPPFKSPTPPPSNAYPTLVHPKDKTLYFTTNPDFDDETETARHTAVQPPGGDLKTEPRDKLGRYDDLGLLGAGGMGEVRKVFDRSLNRTLAMKIIHPKLMDKERAVMRFIEEAQVGAQLQHPNIVPVHEIGQLLDGRYYFTMKEIRGAQFTEKIQGVHEQSDATRWRPATDGTTFRHLLQTFQQVCATVAYAHSQGVVHRDLKPENILIGGFGEVLVVDWGIAKVMGNRSTEGQTGAIETSRSSHEAMLTQVGAVAGTPHFMSPEQARGQIEEIGPAADVYTLGAILYVILSGRPPFEGKSLEDVLEQVRTSTPPTLRTSFRTTPEGGASEGTDPDLSSVLSKLPEDLVALCEQSMQSRREDRGTAETLASKVQQWLDGAERRDRGLKELEAARQTYERTQQAAQEVERAWQEANALLERDGPRSDPAWQAWATSKAALAEKRKLYRRYVLQVQGALAHAPELEEAHLMLAEESITRIVEASAQGNRQAIEVLSQQLHGHLKFIEPSQRKNLETRLASELRDTIAGQRSRRGDLVGRLKQRDSIAEHVGSGARLISLVGTAGVGKTRLVLEVAEDLRSQYSRAFFCDLTEANDDLDIVRLVSQALAVRVSDSDPLGHLTRLLNASPTLLVLDNLEQVQHHAGPICQSWSEELPNLQILVTTRVKLGVSSETVVNLTPLTLLESLELFVHRGRKADSHFELNPENRAQICEIVTKIDRLPLAIELAAARLDLLSLEQLAYHLSKRFHLLRSRGRNGQALQGALDWSWDLLEPWAQAALSQVSIFRGGFNLAAADHVIDVEEHPDSPAMFDVLGELADNSLLRRDRSTDGSTRYSLLESIRAYGRNKLEQKALQESGTSDPSPVMAAQHRHARYFSRMGSDDYIQSLERSNKSSDWAELFRELDNLVLATRHGSPETAPLCCMAALRILGRKGPVSLGVDLATNVLTLPNIPRSLRLQLEIERTKCLRISGRMNEARSVIREATETSLTEGQRLTEAGHVEHQLSRHDAALGYYKAARNVFHRLGEETHEANVIRNIATVHKDRGDLKEALSGYRLALSIHERCNARGEVAADLGNLSNIYVESGDTPQAIRLQEQALAIWKSIEDHKNQAICLSNIGNAYNTDGQPEVAITHIQEALAILQAIGSPPTEAYCQLNLADSLQHLERLDEARAALERAIALAETSAPIAAGVGMGSLGLLLAKTGDHDQSAALFEAGEDAVRQIPAEHIQFLCKKGKAQLLAGSRVAARASLAAAKNLGTKMGSASQASWQSSVNKLEELLVEETP